MASADETETRTHFESLRHESQACSPILPSEYGDHQSTVLVLIVKYSRRLRNFSQSTCSSFLIPTIPQRFGFDELNFFKIKSLSQKNPYLCLFLTGKKLPSLGNSGVRRLQIHLILFLNSLQGFSHAQAENQSTSHLQMKLLSGFTTQKIQVYLI